ncbi:MAG: hypothetical protein WBO46_18685 [Caldilineaceae bacterium]
MPTTCLQVWLSSGERMTRAPVTWQVQFSRSPSPKLCLRTYSISRSPGGQVLGDRAQGEFGELALLHQHFTLAAGLAVPADGPDFYLQTTRTVSGWGVLACCIGL